MKLQVKFKRKEKKWRERSLTGIIGRHGSAGRAAWVYTLNTPGVCVRVFGARVCVRVCDINWNTCVAELIC